jgi:hypothetical protein
MTSTCEWLRGLREFVVVERRTRLPRSAAATAAAEAAERSIIGANLATRLAEIAAIRESRRAFPDRDPDPAIVITTSAVGIAATDDLLASSADLAALARDRVVAATEREYRAWCIRAPDEDFLHHVNVWSWIKMSVPERRRAEFAAYPLAAGEEYWLHREGCAGAAGFDRRSCHLWRWNGRHAALLRAFVVERGVGRPGAAPGDG